MFINFKFRNTRNSRTKYPSYLVSYTFQYAYKVSKISLVLHQVYTVLIRGSHLFGVEPYYSYLNCIKISTRN